MEYKDFIKTLEIHQTDRIKSLSLPESCSLARVPECFMCTLPSVISVINDNIDKICNNSRQKMHIYGLQPAGLAICDSKPDPERIIDPRNPQYHFCCSLKYMLFNKEYANRIVAWSDEQTMIIDFTNGEIIDNDCYLKRLKFGKKPGLVYGKISESQLTAAWNFFNKNSKGEPYGIQSN